MQPTRLARALLQLHGAIIGAGVLEILTPLCPPASTLPPAIDAVLRSFADFSTRTAQLGGTERALLRSLELHTVLQAEWWASVIRGLAHATLPQPVADTLTEVCANLQALTQIAPTLAALLAPERGAAIPDGLSMAIDLPEARQTPPAVSQIASAVRGISELWPVAEALAGQPGQIRLTETELDAGITLHFNAPSAPLQELWQILSAVWEGGAALEYVPPEQRPSVIAETLPTLARLAGQPEAERQHLLRALRSGVTLVFTAGCTPRGIGHAQGLDMNAPLPSASTAHGRTEASAQHAAPRLSDERLRHFLTVIEPQP